MCSLFLSIYIHVSSKFFSFFFSLFQISDLNPSGNKIRKRISPSSLIHHFPRRYNLSNYPFQIKFINQRHRPIPLF